MKNSNTTNGNNNAANNVRNTDDAARSDWNEVSDSTQDVRNGIENVTEPLQSAANQIKDKATDFAQKGMASVKDTAEMAKGAYQKYAEATCEYVAEKPMRSLLISAAVGATLTALLMSGRQMERR